MTATIMAMGVTTIAARKPNPGPKTPSNSAPRKAKQRASFVAYCLALVATLKLNIVYFGCGGGGGCCGFGVVELEKRRSLAMKFGIEAYFF
jgi:hypothetical protein